jgi:cell division GTPase FtsZ
LTCVKKSRMNEWEYRLNTLKNAVDEVICIDNIDITNPITYINLFYDIII